MKFSLITLSLMCAFFVSQAEARQHSDEREILACFVDATYLDGSKSEFPLRVDCDSRFAVEGKCAQEVKNEGSEQTAWEPVGCE